jgi:CheY-like chemotaxis protein
MNRKILLVEDNPQNRYLAMFLLERSGYAVITTADGREALDIAIQQNPLAVLLDIQLPGMDGYAVARALRGIPAFGDTPIIAVTSYAMPADRDKALAAGCVGYIEKPIDPESFVAEIERYLPPRPGGSAR